MKPIKLGIIGCGIAARKLHLPPLMELRNKFEIVVACNHTEEKAKEFSRLAGDGARALPYVLDYKKILTMPEVEAVDILLPIELNYQVTRDCLQAGKHVLVEKPLAVNLREAQSMVKLEKDTDLVTMVAEHLRYHPAFISIKQYLDQGKIGQIQAVFWNIFSHMEESNQYAKTQWRLAHKYPGGFVTDGGVHQIAALRDLLGDITGCGAFLKSMNPGIGKADSLCLQFKAPKGVIGVLNIFFSSPSYQENRLLIMGTEGCMVYENNVLILKKNGETELKEHFNEDAGYKEELEAFYEAVRNHQAVKSSFFEGYCDLKGILDALQLADGGTS
jgi:predicted dehydrogenase